MALRDLEKFLPFVAFSPFSFVRSAALCTNSMAFLFAFIRLLLLQSNVLQLSRPISLFLHTTPQPFFSSSRFSVATTTLHHALRICPRASQSPTLASFNIAEPVARLCQSVVLKWAYSPISGAPSSISNPSLQVHQAGAHMSSFQYAINNSRHVYRHFTHPTASARIHLTCITLSYTPPNSSPYILVSLLQISFTSNTIWTSFLNTHTPLRHKATTPYTEHTKHTTA